MFVYVQNYVMTLGADVHSKVVNIPDSGDGVELVLVDCSGRDIYNDLLLACWVNTSLVLAVYDVTSEVNMKDVGN